MPKGPPPTRRGGEGGGRSQGREPACVAGEAQRQVEAAVAAARVEGAPRPACCLSTARRGCGGAVVAEASQAVLEDRPCSTFRCTVKGEVRRQ